LLTDRGQTKKLLLCKLTDCKENAGTFDDDFSKVQSLINPVRFDCKAAFL